MSRRFKGAALGEVLRIGPKESYRVVGLFTAGGSSAESEVWVDIKDLKQNTKREGFVSSVQVRAASVDDGDKLRRTIRDDPQFKLAAFTESEFFAQQSQTVVFFKAAGILIAIFLSIGAMFAAANTMFSAVSSRTREIGTMRGPRLLPVLDPDLVPGRVGPPLRDGRLAGSPGDVAALVPDLRDEQHRHLRRGERQLPLRTPGPGRRLRH